MATRGTTAAWWRNASATTALANYALDKARFNGSEALESGAESARPRDARVARHLKRMQGTTPSARRPSAPGPVQQKWALVVGIGQFTDSGIPRLNYTTADAKCIRRRPRRSNHRRISLRQRSCANR